MSSTALRPKPATSRCSAVRGSVRLCITDLPRMPGKRALGSMYACNLRRRRTASAQKRRRRPPLDGGQSHLRSRGMPIAAPVPGHAACYWAFTLRVPSEQQLNWINMASLARYVCVESGDRSSLAAVSSARLSRVGQDYWTSLASSLILCRRDPFVSVIPGCPTYNSKAAN